MVITLSRYIITTAVAMCAVCLLVTYGTRAVDKKETSKEVVTNTVNVHTTTKTEKEIVVDKKADDKTTKATSTKANKPGKEYVTYYTECDIIDIAKLLLRECGGIPSDTEKACVAWCVLNRVDKYGSSIHDVLRAPNQFAFRESTKVRNDLYELAKDVLKRWNDEKNGIVDSGRVLPQEYMYFHGDGVHNYFRNAFSGNYDTWDYSLESPYKN